MTSSSNSSLGARDVRNDKAFLLSIKREGECLLAFFLISVGKIYVKWRIGVEFRHLVLNDGSAFFARFWCNRTCISADE
jgi:hypothetical protein